MPSQRGMAMVTLLRDDTLVHELQTVQPGGVRGVTGYATRGILGIRGLPSRQKTVIVSIHCFVVTTAASIARSTEYVRVAFSARSVTQRIRRDRRVMIIAAQIRH